jgi:hypothetical protein
VIVNQPPNDGLAIFLFPESEVQRDLVIASLSQDMFGHSVYKLRASPQIVLEYRAIFRFIVKLQHPFIRGKNIKAVIPLENTGECRLPRAYLSAT